MKDVLDEVAAEMGRQHSLWGEQNHDNGTGTPADRGDREVYKRANKRAVEQDKLTWRLILLEEVFEALAEREPAKLREELVQVAAVAGSWIQAIDRKAGKR